MASSNFRSSTVSASKCSFFAIASQSVAETPVFQSSLTFAIDASATDATVKQVLYSPATLKITSGNTSVTKDQKVTPLVIYNIVSLGGKEEGAFSLAMFSMQTLSMRIRHLRL